MLRPSARSESRARCRRRRYWCSVAARLAATASSTIATIAANTSRIASTPMVVRGCAGSRVPEFAGSRVRNPVPMHWRTREPGNPRTGERPHATKIRIVAVSHRPEPLAQAYAVCEAVARAHYENFPVASRLLPRAMRPHVAAVYAFARVADDFADEGAVPGPDRRARLAAWQSRLHRAAASADPGESATTEDLIFVALGHSIRALKLPVPLFDDLLSAFGQDTMTSRYASWPDLLDYCRRSANPIGRLVLRIA